METGADNRFFKIDPNLAECLIPLAIDSPAGCVPCDDGVSTGGSGGGTSIHNLLSGLQGGSVDQYYHLSALQYQAVNGANAPSATNVFATIDDLTSYSPFPGGGTAGQVLSTIDGSNVNLRWITNTITASNGITITGTNATLGGTLTQNTTINGGGNTLTINGPMQLTNIPFAPTDVVRLADVVLADGVISGMAVSTAGTIATVAPGSYRINNTTHTLSTATHLTLEAQDATLSRFDVIYGDISGVLHIASGALASSPSIPVIPQNALSISVVSITPTTVTTTPTAPITNYVNTTTPQSNIGGDKSWDGMQTFNNSVQMPGVASGDVFSNASGGDLILQGTEVWTTQSYRRSYVIGLGSNVGDYNIFAQINDYDSVNQGKCNLILVNNDGDASTNTTLQEFDFPLDFGLTALTWYIVAPSKTVLDSNVVDYALEIQMLSGVGSAGGRSYQLRVRRTIHATDTPPLNLGVWIQCTPLWGLTAPLTTGNSTTVLTPYTSAQTTITGGDVLTSGNYKGLGLMNITSPNNAYVQTGVMGTHVNRNMADGNAALSVTNSNTGANGLILNVQNYYRSLLSVDAYGGITHATISQGHTGNEKGYWMIGGLKPNANGTKLTALQVEPIYGTSTVATTGSLVGGTGYPNGSHTANFSGGTGFNLTATVTVISGAVTAYTIIDGGINYTVSDVVSFLIEDSSGNPVGSGGSITITGITTYTGIVSVSAWFKNAPIQLDPISTPSVQQTGMIWQDGTHLYAYINGAARQLDQQASGGSSGVNGLNGTTNIGLGGSLSNNVNILTNSFQFNVQSTANVGLSLIDGVSASLYGGDTNDFGSVSLGNTSSFIGMNHSSPVKTMGFNFVLATGTVFTDTYLSAGISYAADYSAANSSNPRWLTDKAYVDSKSAVGVNGLNGTTNIGLGGALNQNTSIDIGDSALNYDFSITGTVLGGSGEGSANYALGIGNGSFTSSTGYNAIPISSGVTADVYTLFNQTQFQTEILGGDTGGLYNSQLIIGSNLLSSGIYSTVIPFLSLYVATTSGSDVRYQGLFTENSSLPGSMGTFTAGMLVADDIDLTGLFYKDDYSAANSSNPRWIPDKGYVDTHGGFINPMTTAGDIIVGGTSGTPTRMGMGSANYVLGVNTAGTGLEYKNVVGSSGIQALGGAGTLGFYLYEGVLAATDANITTGPFLDTCYVLPVITANRTLGLSGGFQGRKLNIWNRNTSGFTWSFGVGSTVITPDGTAVTIIPNNAFWQMENPSGTAWVITNSISGSTWSGSVIAGQYGGTGVANTGKTITLGGNLTTSGAFATTITATAATSVTLPTTGTLYGTATGSITSAQLLASMSDETGTGSLVFSISPALTGTPTAPTPAASDNSTKIATTAYTDRQVNAAIPFFASNNFSGTGSSGSPYTLSVTNTGSTAATLVSGVLNIPNLLTANNTFTGTNIHTDSTTSTTVNPLVTLTNLTTSTGSTNLYSPALQFRANLFNTSTDKTLDFFIKSNSNSSTTVGQLLFTCLLAGGSETTLLSIDRFANFNVGGVFVTSLGAIGATTTPAFFMTNNTASTSGTPLQKSTMFQQFGSVWNTTATAAPNYFSFGFESTGVSGAVPTASWDFYGYLGASTTITRTKLMSVDAVTGNFTTIGRFTGFGALIKPTLTPVNNPSTAITAAHMVTGASVNTSAAGNTYTTATAAQFATALGGVTQGTRYVFTVDSSASTGLVGITLGSGFTWGAVNGSAIGIAGIATYMVVFQSSTAAIISQIV